MFLPPIAVRRISQWMLRSTVGADCRQVGGRIQIPQDVRIRASSATAVVRRRAPLPQRAPGDLRLTGKRGRRGLSRF
ncbi:hypothetical protein ACNQT2_11620, partial [Corynebacterium diphtheriae]